MNDQRVLSAVDGMPTPVAVVDLEIVDRNITKMAKVAEAASMQLRPHAKTHKSREIARRQLQNGAAGLTVATVAEAEYFLEVEGLTDLLIAYPSVGDWRQDRLRALATRHHDVKISVSVDQIETALQVPTNVDLFWEVDTGHHRMGTQPGEETAVAVGRMLERVSTSRFRGLLSFPGHVYNVDNPSVIHDVADNEWRVLTETARMLKDHGVEVADVSIGSTPTARFAGLHSGPTELRPGSYVYGDTKQVELGSLSLQECALSIVATVVSISASGDRLVIDAGTKALSSDIVTTQGHGVVIGHPELALARMSEEHGVVVGANNQPVTESGLSVGGRVVVIPTHCCTTVNLHDRIRFVDAEGRALWEAVGARGRWDQA